MNCPTCGADLPDGTAVCPICGAALAPATNSVNNALFNQAPVNTSTVTAKKGGAGATVGIIAGIVAVLAIAFAVCWFVLGWKYNGTYQFDSASMYGETYSAADLESMAGQSLNMTLKVSFGKCTLDADALGYTGSGSAKIRFKGDKVTFIDGSEEMEGTYDKSTKTISLEANGVTMYFKKK